MIQECELVIQGKVFFFLGATDPPNGADFFGLKTHFSIECGSLAELRSQ